MAEVEGPDRHPSLSRTDPGPSDLEVAAHLRERERMLTRAHRKRRGARYHSLVLHWLGRCFRRPRPAVVAPLPAVEPGQVGISFAGHASVLVRYANLTIACDPMLGRWVRGIKRAVQPGLSPADLGDVDLILISHAHADHLHRKTLSELPRSATVVVPPRTAHRVSDLGFARVVELEVGQSIQHRDVDVITAPVRHGDPDEVRALSYLIRGNGPSVYFCGDSGYFSGFADIGERLAPDIALLPVGGYAPHSFRERHMSPLDALYALEDLGARLMIPIHHGSFALSYEHLQEPSRWLAELVRERDLGAFVVELEPGESRVFVPPRGQRLDHAAGAMPGTEQGPGGERRAAPEQVPAAAVAGLMPGSGIAVTPIAAPIVMPIAAPAHARALRPPTSREIHHLPPSTAGAYLRAASVVPGVVPGAAAGAAPRMDMIADGTQVTAGLFDEMVDGVVESVVDAVSDVIIDVVLDGTGFQPTREPA